MEVPSGEVWKPISGSTGYEVSNFGNVRSYRRPGTSRALAITPRPLKALDAGSRLEVGIDGRKRSIHRLVALTFIGPPPEGKPFVLHGDENYKNNVVTNLRWGNHKENMDDYLRHLQSTCCEHCSLRRENG